MLHVAATVIAAGFGPGGWPETARMCTKYREQAGGRLMSDDRIPVIALICAKNDVAIVTTLTSNMRCCCNVYGGHTWP